VANWLVKTEPDVYSIDDLVREERTLWDKVRNYQARNYLRDMKVGDRVLIYHSNAEPSGIIGVARVSKTAKADPTQFEVGSEYFDPAATKENPRWFAPEIKHEAKFNRLIPISELRQVRHLSKMVLLKRGSRLSVQPVTDSEFSAIIKLV
jgi:predicted RNA-binding protein with PUA-like domain